ncbi:MAG: hypothetical protein Q9176_004959 [Flavoplaca citrina]
MDEAKEDRENVNPDPKANKPSRPVRPRKAAKRRKPKGKATCEPPSKSYLDRLPAEILDMICEDLWETDLPALRLQCRYLYKAATAHMFDEAFVRFKKSSIDSLLQLSAHPFLSQNVKTLSYEPNLLKSQTREEWQDRIPLRDYHDSSNIPSPPKKSASERDWRLFHRTVKRVALHGKRTPYSAKELDTAWPIYQRYLQEQEDLFERDNACQDLHQAVRHFSNLRAIHVNFGWGLWCGPGWSPDTSVNPYESGLTRADSTTRYPGDLPGVEQIVSLIRMLGTLEVKLDSLRIGSVDWKFFLQCEGPGNLSDMMKRIVQSLKDLEIVITTWTDLGSHDEEEDEVQQQLEVRTFFDKGSLGRILAQAPDLRRVSIELDAYEVECPIDFQFLVLDTQWSHLHTIKLESINTHESHWMGFFERHASTIKNIRLATIRLVDGEWPDVLERMQQLLSLEEAEFDESLSSVVPSQLWWLDAPGYTSSKDDSVQANRTRWALEKFMVHGGRPKKINNLFLAPATLTLYERQAILAT